MFVPLFNGSWIRSGTLCKETAEHCEKDTIIRRTAKCIPTHRCFEECRARGCQSTGTADAQKVPASKASGEGRSGSTTDAGGEVIATAGGHAEPIAEKQSGSRVVGVGDTVTDMGRRRCTRNDNPNYGGTTGRLASSGQPATVTPQKRKGSPLVVAEETFSSKKLAQSGNSGKSHRSDPCAKRSVPYLDADKLVAAKASEDRWKLAHTEYNLKKKWKDTYPRLTHEEYEHLNLFRMGKRISLGGSAEMVMKRPTVVKRLLSEDGLLTWSRQWDKRGRKVTGMIPTLFMNRENGQMRLFRIGNTYPASVIALMAGGNRSMRQRDVYQPGGQSVLFASEPYKNGLESVMQAQKGRDPTFDRDDSGKALVKTTASFEQDEILEIFGSGGAAVEPGLYAVDIRRKTKDTGDIIIPPAQNPYDGGINQALVRLSHEKSVVAVFSQYQNFNPGYAKAKPQSGLELDLLMFLGYYEMIGHRHERDSAEEIAMWTEQMKTANAAVTRWSQFRRRPYLKFCMRRLFSPEEWTALRLREERLPADYQIYKHIPLDDKIEDGLKLSLRIPLADSYHWQETEFGEEDVIDYCVTQDALEKFIQVKEPLSTVPNPLPCGVGVTQDLDDSGKQKKVALKEIKGTSGSIMECLVSVLVTTQAAFQRYLGGA